jgi:hypothetical protein
MKQHLKVHDRVSWNTSQGMTHGKIVRVISTHTSIEGHTVAASKEEPQYEVESDKTGKHAVHRADALHLRKD